MEEIGLCWRVVPSSVRAHELPEKRVKACVDLAPRPKKGRKILVSSKVLLQEEKKKKKRFKIRKVCPQHGILIKKKEQR